MARRRNRRVDGIRINEGTSVSYAELLLAAEVEDEFAEWLAEGLAEERDEASTHGMSVGFSAEDAAEIGYSGHTGMSAGPTSFATRLPQRGTTCNFGSWSNLVVVNKRLRKNRGNVCKIKGESGPKRKRKVTWFSLLETRTMGSLLKALHTLSACGCPMECATNVHLDSVRVGSTQWQGGVRVWLICETYETRENDEAEWIPVTDHEELAKKEAVSKVMKLKAQKKARKQKRKRVKD